MYKTRGGEGGAPAAAHRELHAGGHERIVNKKELLTIKNR